MLTTPFPYIWSEGEAQNIVDWFLLLRHSKKGELAGELIVFKFVAKISCQLYGWRNKETGRKGLREALWKWEEKMQSPSMEAGIALYEISTQAVKNEEVYEYYTAGVKRDQSKIIVNEAKLMLKGSPLRSKFKITKDLIEHRKTGSFIKALCKEDGQKGE